MHKALPILIFIIFITIYFYIPVKVVIAAEDNVGISAYVLPHKPTDTINDFDFSGLNLQTLKTSPPPEVKGEQIIERRVDRSLSIFCHNIWTKITRFLISVFS